MVRAWNGAFQSIFGVAFEVEFEGGSEQLRQGGIIVGLTAEGRRSEDGRLGPYKKGPVVMAITSQAPIHPVYIAGSRDCMAPGSWKIRPGKVTMRYLVPISTTGMTYEDRNVLLQRLRVVGESAHAKWFEGGGSVA